MHLGEEGIEKFSRRLQVEVALQLAQFLIEYSKIRIKSFEGLDFLERKAVGGNRLGTL